MNPNYFTPKNADIFECKTCDFKCCKESDYTRHLLTDKHFRRMNPNSFTPKNAKKTIYACECGKLYKHQSSLCNHKKKCEYTKENDVGTENEKEEDILNSSNLMLEILKQNQEFKELMIEQNKQPLNELPSDNKDMLIMELVKQNQEFKELMIEQNKQMMELANKVGNNNNNTTTNNTKFNLQLFLNETCKDAMNITEFVNSLVLNFEDLENMGHLGYVEGICKIFLRGLRGVEVTKRPFHCSDVKRETMFVKDLAGWEKENSDNEKLTATIKRIAGKNFKQATAWMANHPKAVLETDSHPHMQYMKMMSQCLGGLTAAEDKSNYNKIIKRVAQEVLIDKGKD